jgi:hypothetical protein
MLDVSYSVIPIVNTYVDMTCLLIAYRMHALHISIPVVLSHSMIMLYRYVYARVNMILTCNTNSYLIASFDTQN